MLACVAFSEVSGAVSVALENATATFSQDPLGGCPCSPSQASVRRQIQMSRIVYPVYPYAIDIEFVLD